MAETEPDEMAGTPGGYRPVVYLHIGSPKSGTTFLQGVLWQNRELLAEQGLLLPGGSFRAQEQAAWDLRGIVREPTDPTAPWAGRWDDLAEEVLTERASVAVISHETLAAADEQQIERAVKTFDGADVRLIYTVRDLAGLLTSEWQEYVKHRCPQDYVTWLGEVIDGGSSVGSGRWFWRVHDSVEVLRRWSRSLPPDHVHVLTVPRPDAPRDLLWHRFAGLIGVLPESVRLDDVRGNASLGVVETELLRRLNIALDPDVPQWLYTSTVTSVLGHQTLPWRAETRPVPFPDDRERWVRERAAELSAGLRAGGYDIVGDLDELGPRGDLPPSDHSPVTESELLEASVDTVLGLLDRIRDQRDEIEELRAQVDDLHAERADEIAQPLPKAMVRHMSDRHHSVLRMRIAYWNLVERMRRGEPAPPEDPEDLTEPPDERDVRVTLWPRTLEREREQA